MTRHISRRVIVGRMLLLLYIPIYTSRGFPVVECRALPDDKAPTKLKPRTISRDGAIPGTLWDEGVTSDFRRTNLASRTT